MEQLTLPRREELATAPLPPEAPLDMPEQSLTTYDRARRRRLGARRACASRAPASG